MAERVLVVGSGAREHALAYKLSGAQESKNLREVVTLFGNAGLARDFECITPEDTSIIAMVETAKKIAPDLVVIGPENYLADGLVDALQSHGLSVFGPSQNAAQLESSKAFTKNICEEASIATAQSFAFSTYDEALSFLVSYPHEEIVIKADGLCAGKGVTVCHSKEYAKETVHRLYNEDGFARLGLKNHHIIVEEFLSGSEVSVFGAVNGADVALFCPMQDYKRLKDFDGGPNTGGMGAVGPLGRDLSERESFLEKIRERIFLPALRTLASRQNEFFGLLYAGLMLTNKGLKLLEFNVRFGDPETQALLHGTKADIYPLLLGIAQRQKLDMDFFRSEILPMEPTISIVLASSGYPYEKSESYPISLPTHCPHGTKLYFSATSSAESASLRAESGRIMSVTASADTVDRARSLGYGLLSEIDFTGMQYRSDIGTNMTDLSFN